MVELERKKSKEDDDETSQEVRQNTLLSLAVPSQGSRQGGYRLAGGRLDTRRASYGRAERAARGSIEEARMMTINRGAIFSFRNNPLSKKAGSHNQKSLPAECSCLKETMSLNTLYFRLLTIGVANAGDVRGIATSRETRRL